jgi:hypothetical protein
MNTDMVTRNHNGLHRPFPASRVRSLLIIPPVISANTRVRNVGVDGDQLKHKPRVSETLEPLFRARSRFPGILESGYLRSTDDTARVQIRRSRHILEGAQSSMSYMSAPWCWSVRSRYEQVGNREPRHLSISTAVAFRFDVLRVSMPSLRRHRSFAQHPPPCRSGAVSFPLSDIRIISELPKYLTGFRTSHRSRHLPSRMLNRPLAAPSSDLIDRPVFSVQLV